MNKGPDDLHPRGGYEKLSASTCDQILRKGIESQRTVLSLVGLREDESSNDEGCRSLGGGAVSGSSKL